ncbi:MAG: hypothetical protein QGG42_14840 [Phycisphaerae bacterium]|jgi:hypothetical protein|nr:hypothetical protein [Phycisphaerae bacterium]
MKRIVLTIVWLSAAVLPPVGAAVIRTVPRPGESTTRPAATSRPAGTSKLSIRIMRDDWGDAGTADIHRVLKSAAGELWRSFPDRRLHPIIVQRGRRAPITLYRRGPKGEYLIKVTTKGRYWCQFAYQFAHEFCHVLANYSHKTPVANKWFEESLCEMASIYSMRRMAITWKTSPPHSHWRSYAADIQAYVDDLQGPEDKLPKGKTLAAWYKENRTALRRAPCLRDKNRIVANSLIGLFEASPEHWPAIGYLNSGKPVSDSLQGHLANWYRQTPARHRKIVGDIIKRFELKIPQIPLKKQAS